MNKDKKYRFYKVWARVTTKYDDGVAIEEKYVIIRSIGDLTEDKIKFWESLHNFEKYNIKVLDYDVNDYDVTERTAKNLITTTKHEYKLEVIKQ